MKKNPYENNEYLKNDEELLQEMLFFKKFQLPMEKSEETEKQSEEDIDL